MTRSSIFPESGAKKGGVRRGSSCRTFDPALLRLRQMGPTRVEVTSFPSSRAIAWVHCNLEVDGLSVVRADESLG